VASPRSGRPWGENMYYVYILKSKKDNKNYIGSTNNLLRRLAEHNKGKVKSTKYRKPFKIVYLENFYSKKKRDYARNILKRIKDIMN